MPDEARKAVDAHVAALNHGDLEAILDTFTSDAVFTSDGGTARGRAELAGLFDGVTDEPRPTMIVRRAEADGDTIDCRLTRRFTVQAEDGTVAAAHDVELRAVFTVRGGAIARVVVDPIA